MFIALECAMFAKRVTPYFNIFELPENVTKSDETLTAFLKENIYKEYTYMLKRKYNLTWIWKY